MRACCHVLSLADRETQPRVSLRLSTLGASSKPPPDPPAEHRSGFVTMAGRPNVGKSSLVNALCGEKVSIVSDKPQTTRHRVRGVLTRPDYQIVFVDTPGLHKPVTALGERVNATALDSLDDVDVTCLVLDATAAFGGGDRWVADRIDLRHTVVVVNKIDRATPGQIGEMLDGRRRSTPPRTCRCRRAPATASTSSRPSSPPACRPVLSSFPPDTVRDVTRRGVDRRAGARTAARRHPRRAAVLDRHPGHRVGGEPGACRHRGRAAEPEGDGDRQGRPGVSRRPAQRARAQLPEGLYLDLRVKVDKNWQRRADRVQRLGYAEPARNNLASPVRHRVVVRRLVQLRSATSGLGRGVGGEASVGRRRRRSGRRVVDGRRVDVGSASVAG